MPELGSYGSVRGAAGNSRPYRERRNGGTIDAHGQPASEKRQGRKSRWVGHPAVRRALWRFEHAGRDGDCGSSRSERLTGDAGRVDRGWWTVGTRREELGSTAAGVMEVSHRA